MTKFSGAKALLFALWLSSAPVFSQVPKDILVQEIAGCAVRRGNGGLDNDPQPYQPCESPPINTLLIREFAKGVYGFYANYSQFATTQSNCTVMGLGKLKANSIDGSVFMVDQKEFHESCKVSLDWTAKKPKGFVGFEFRELSACSGFCGMNNNVGSINFGGNTSNAFSPAFDCSKAVFPAEQVICLDWKLSKLDFRVAELWQEIGGDDQEKKKQFAWLKSRNSCGYDGSCIRSSYVARIKNLCNVLGRKMDAQDDCY